MYNVGMRAILRVFAFTLISLFITQYIIEGFSYGIYPERTIILLVIALALLNFFMIPVFKLISLPTGGVGYLFLSFLMTLVTLYVLTLFIPGFKIIETTLNELIVFGFILPSKHLNVFWSAVFSALLFSLINDFFNWISYRK